MKDSNWWVKLFLGPLAFLCVIAFWKPAESSQETVFMAGVTLWVAIWWMTEVVDLAVTSLLPLILLPALGIMDAKTTAIQYNDQVIFLFVGGFIISFAIEKWGVHKRISLKLLSLIGTSPSRILFGVMITTYFISMWMSNTATVLMMLTAVLAINYLIEGEDKSGKESKIPKTLLLGLAYSGSIGGMASLVGTPTNMIFSGFYQSHFSENEVISFSGWMKFGLPVSFILLLFTYFLLKKLYLRKEEKLPFSKEYFNKAYKALGNFTKEEKLVVCVFALTALLWFTRSTIDFGFFTMKGWSTFFKNPGFIQDSTVAVFMAVTLFIIPSGKQNKEALLVWKDVQKLPYNIILLFGSGFALAKGFEMSGLSDWLAGKLVFLKGYSPVYIVLSICIVVCIISEFASNVASIQLVLPILMAMSKSTQIDPLVLMVPATLAASLGFMLPVATAANTIVYGTGKIPVRSMFSAGFWVDLAGIILITLVAMLYFS
ncbi:MAG: SLC13/DASS family transporter [Flavobacteriales bacterium]|nr:SLC13/DASS family transporter [Flavobacteriales bacterium]